MIKLLQLDKAEVSFVLTDDERIHQLNKIYRGKDRPTDVLAFAMHEGEDGALSAQAGLLGDVVISVATAARQAAERKVTLADELELLFAHGLCHLLGYDHQDDAEERTMNARMARLLAAARKPVARAAAGRGRRGSR